ncbi:MAG: hypothetical protein JXR37_28105 [Kiritimatiellae bacterium]|nr:hypothetical protein [Kiritimatiellia bacterium]
MSCAWKENWPESKQHYMAWWRREGLVLNVGIEEARARPAEPAEDPGPAASLEQRYTDAGWRARRNHYVLSRHRYGADCLPIAETNIGPGSLALFVGSEPGFSPGTVWYNPCMERDAEPEKRLPLRFDPGSRWWQTSEAIVRECARLADGKYIVGCPDLIENIDTVASLRGTERLLMDMIERPDWVCRVVNEVNRVWFEAYERLYAIIRTESDGAAWAAFGIWGPGKTAKVQCDASAMFSPAMFEQFVVPALTQQCEWLDYSIFHLDGHQCIPHLDALLGIEALDAVEWTPDPMVPRSGGDPAWYAMYRRILDAGKSVQAVNVKPEEVIPLLDACGGKGMYIMTRVKTAAEAEALWEKAAAYR